MTQINYRLLSMTVPRDHLIAVLPTIAEPCSQVSSVLPMTPLDVCPGAQQVWGRYIPRGRHMNAFLREMLAVLGGLGSPSCGSSLAAFTLQVLPPMNNY